jgi:alkanesulfonate monooxygenase SsuD/methylene tetrahydromethanopterin reductase-like flavin-dependent oxidoreductase (luciferase family)
MEFGFTLKPENDITRTLALTRQAEAAGFGYGWLFDSHSCVRISDPDGRYESMPGTCV